VTSDHDRGRPSSGAGLATLNACLPICDGACLLVLSPQAVYYIWVLTALGVCVSIVDAVKYGAVIFNGLMIALYLGVLAVTFF
jgi:hypothetical protein